jgi:hypothetical protein
MRNWENDFAYYEGETFITLGSLQEIHEYTGIPLERLKEYSKKITYQTLSVWKDAN